MIENPPTSCCVEPGVASLALGYLPRSARALHRRARCHEPRAGRWAGGRAVSNAGAREPDGSEGGDHRRRPDRRHRRRRVDLDHVGRGEHHDEEGRHNRHQGDRRHHRPRERGDDDADERPVHAGAARISDVRDLLTVEGAAPPRERSGSGGQAALTRGAGRDGVRDRQAAASVSSSLKSGASSGRVRRG